jgi:hypothetical protein
VKDSSPAPEKKYVANEEEDKNRIQSALFRKKKIWTKSEVSNFFFNTHTNSNTSNHSKVTRTGAEDIFIGKIKSSANRMRAGFAS